MQTDLFSNRHIGVSAKDIDRMTEAIGVSSLDQLIFETLPDNIKSSPLELRPAMSENEYLDYISRLGKENKILKSYIGLGYNECITPSVIKRNILESPGWYTAYTPYQAEISQGRLEALLNYQTMIVDLAGMEIANASLLDEGTAASEAMTMLFASENNKSKEKQKNKFFISEQTLPQTVAILKTKAKPLGIILVVGHHEKHNLDDSYFGQLLQYPGKYGQIYDYENHIKKATKLGVKTVVAADILSLVLLRSPGEIGADVVVGTTQRFGVPLGYGGPHAAFFATKELYKRHLPGRIIGVTNDADGNPIMRMALQTREQHIRRDKATSNICTAQVLLAVMSSMYAVYHGVEGLRYIADKVHADACHLNKVFKNLGLTQLNDVFFDTLLLDNIDVKSLKSIASSYEINFNYIDDRSVSISINEATLESDIDTIIVVFEKYTGRIVKRASQEKSEIFKKMLRKDDILRAKVFNKYHSETEMLRYIKRLEQKDLSLNHSMIPLGSCTMKLNATTEIMPISTNDWSNVHPFAPKEQTQGYRKLLESLEKQLSTITGFKATSLQPNSGAQGEYCGLMIIRSYYESKSESHRNICLIPASSHGTNPASAVLAGMKVVVIKTTERGNIDVKDLKEKTSRYKSDLAALMITYPSTHGVFESTITEITSIVHENGGQVYMDGANMNAQVGLTTPKRIGADVCHLNLHKTFAIPHGGGGPGVGPVCVAEHLEPFLPTNPIVPVGGKQAKYVISSAPFGNAMACLISHAYICMLGAEGLKKSTEVAILNANYIKSKLEKHFKILYTGERGRVAHEMILDCRSFKSHGIEVVDMAKRLIDYGFHAPTVSFPVLGTLMIEPTESESKKELDRFCEVMISIKNEILHTPELLKNAPHTLKMLTSDEWPFSYTREQAAFPMRYLKNNKFWPTNRRANEAFGDRNLICSCESIEAYIE